MCVPIISEATRHIPDELLARHPEIPWQKIRGIGNLLRHVYFRVDHEILWDIYEHDLDGLGNAIAAIANDVEPGG